MVKHYSELVNDTKFSPEGSIANLARVAAKLLTINFTVTLNCPQGPLVFSDVQLNDKDDKLYLRICGGLNVPRWLDITDVKTIRDQILVQYEEFLDSQLRDRKEDIDDMLRMYFNNWTTPNKG